ncbi:hypothetical protein GUITHDRAFT_112492 [Guillardia theta CCMP2712]|uniref:Actin-binding transcription modulator n=1 Tax=Guillardia theta (strain CCMP2712) TaxID=905079 RepID=L1IZ16_GUITC|nr:hypothetical protein GUITHDRAFT_112492 [Guillardia theta CCMP2712]EKX41518.1 hypothetical protein GUITHDRAFT_112492 [Guillardia theta CCMP2712]|eukprot:XP_005828498.1 hypothetical protein GUITHDRAFT_112492 [Guillardia theta CCMP2712]
MEDGVENPRKRLKTGEESGHMTQTSVGAACLRSREKLLARERDYTHYFATNVGGQEGADQFVYQHFNSLCVVGLAPSHVAFRDGRRIVAVDFDVGRSGDKTEVKPSGKKKNGSLFVKEDSRLCDVVCDDGSRFKIRAAIQGHLLEMNSNLQSNPDLLNLKASSEGFISIIQPRRELENKLRESCKLLSLDEFNKVRSVESVE